MRPVGVVAAACLLLVSQSAFAQEWSTYTNQVDRFEVNLPGQPKVDAITWPSEYGAVFPGRVYSLAQAAGPLLGDGHRLHRRRAHSRREDQPY